MYNTFTAKDNVNKFSYRLFHDSKCRQEISKAVHTLRGAVDIYGFCDKASSIREHYVLTLCQNNAVLDTPIYDD